jgi:predicted dehydrogenase
LARPPLARIKIGLVGLNFGRTIVDQLFASPDFDLTALCDKSQSRLERVSPHQKIARYRELDDLLEDKNVEAIGLFTGPEGRAELIRKIIRTGRHVITTKPLEMNSEAMLDVLQEARRLGRVVHCNSPGPLLSPDLKVIQKWIHQYGLGRPVGAYADAWVSYREAADGSWYDDPIRCPAAPIYRLGIYLINDLVRLWGRVEKVDLLESRLFTGRPTSDNSQLALLFENKALATIYASFCINDGDHYRNGLTLNFENGTIYRNTGPAWSAAASGRCHLALVKSQQNQPRIIAEEKVMNRSGSYQWDYFMRAIRGEGDPDEATPEEMVEGIRVMQAIAKIGTGVL